MLGFGDACDVVHWAKASSKSKGGFINVGASGVFYGDGDAADAFGTKDDLAAGG